MRLSNSSLTPHDIAELTAWRRELHRRPELSGEEAETAKAVAAMLPATKPDRVLTGLGGHGVAAIYDSGTPGPTVMFRCELDGLPIEELSDADHRSQVPGKGHLCGHDGHMAILAGLARQLGRQRPARGRAILMFQPAEENGAGAAAVIADPRFAEIKPDYAFSLHNFPGIPLGEARLSVGSVNCASRGMKIVLEGRTAHSSMPETGISPMQAIATLMPAFTELSTGRALEPGFRLVTVTHVDMGEPAFGIAPGRVEIWVTLRTLLDDGMAALVEAAETLVHDTADNQGLAAQISYHEIFGHCLNHAEAVARFREAFDAESIRHDECEPMRASEDFGLFGSRGGAKSAMFLFGAGERTPQLHNPDYDFPDALIEPGARIFERVARDLLG